MKDMISWLSEEESGQGLVEYALILAFISIAVVAGVTALGVNLNSKYTEVHTKIPH